MERFGNASSEEILKLKEASTAKNTNLSTANWLKVFYKWAVFEIQLK